MPGSLEPCTPTLPLGVCVSLYNRARGTTFEMRALTYSCWVVDWCSGLTSQLGLTSAFVFSVVEKMSVCTACVGVGVRTTLLVFTQLSSVTEGFKMCWRTGHLETILFNPCLLRGLCAPAAITELPIPILFLLYTNHSVLSWPF